MKSIINMTKKNYHFFIVRTNFPRFPIWKKFQFHYVSSLITSLTDSVNQREPASNLDCLASKHARHASNALLWLILVLLFSHLSGSGPHARGLKIGLIRVCHACTLFLKEFNSFTDYNLTTRQHRLVLICLLVFLFHCDQRYSHHLFF